jgi:hypothetical protein
MLTEMLKKELNTDKVPFRHMLDHRQQRFHPNLMVLVSSNILLMKVKMRTAIQLQL